MITCATVTRLATTAHLIAGRVVVIETAQLPTVRVALLAPLIVATAVATEFVLLLVVKRVLRALLTVVCVPSVVMGRVKQPA